MRLLARDLKINGAECYSVADNWDEWIFEPHHPNYSQVKQAFDQLNSAFASFSAEMQRSMKLYG